MQSFDRLRDALAYLYLYCKRRRPGLYRNVFQIERMKDGCHEYHMGNVVYDGDEDLVYFYEERTDRTWEFDKHGDYIYLLNDRHERLQSYEDGRLGRMFSGVRR